MTNRTLRDFVGETVWGDLLALAFDRWHPAGSVLMHQGESGTHVLAVRSGVAKVVRAERNGELTLLAFRGPGELLGEVAVLGGGGRLASVETLTRCCVAVMSRAEFLRFVAKHDLSPALMRYALARLSESDRARSGGAVLTRLAAILVRVAEISGQSGDSADSSGQSLELALTRQELAQYLRASRNTVTAQLAGLEASGVHARRGRIVITDLTALRRVSEGLAD
ncbi:Crp/Fnr family transcriptional regulator [Streptomyces johnsoniae]|uniref:Crp/Fnr family transcriptional regulator n=1 Tax=Streptomyces johnsoniae TaxID=3075532 RepID=A0ABU2SDK6_9ACTN|nr:Crp/Fnr family transcriptional regulator [Streptomyces sp. DSM 41886]MDT0447062.1 Crp/Fnr family transcriptional regulator [Streptomyces sp. DSM 41886]